MGGYICLRCHSQLTMAEIVEDWCNTCHSKAHLRLPAERSKDLWVRAASVADQNNIRGSRKVVR